MTDLRNYLSSNLIIHISLFISHIVSVSAQSITEMYSQLHRSPLISEEYIRLQLPGGDSLFRRFMEKLDRLTSGKPNKVNIVHIGGSHVQGGTLPATIRNNLVHIHPLFMGERGLIFPYKMAATNNPSDYKVTFTGEWHGHRSSVSTHYAEFGICGITATTYDPDASFSIQIYPLNSREYTYDRIRIYHPFGPNYMKPTWNGSENLLITWENPVAGYTEFVLENPASSNHFQLQSFLDSNQKFVIQGIHFYLDKPSLVYHAIGVNGANSSSYLRQPYFERQIRLLKADMVLFGIGINDANVPAGKFDKDLFKLNYEKLIKSFQKGNKDVFFIFLTNTDSYYQRKQPNKNALSVQEAMYELAAKYHGAVIDVLEIMGGLGSSKRWRQAGLMASDLIHFTPKGYELLGNAISAALIESFKKYYLPASTLNISINVDLDR